MEQDLSGDLHDLGHHAIEYTKKVFLEEDATLTMDSFALVMESFLAVQYKTLKQIVILKIGEGDQPPYIHMVIENALSRNGKSMCIFENFLAFRNL